MLFACSRCFSRHPFEELSPGQQLCKECRGSFPVVKCTFCRSEFQQTSKGSTSTICKKCEQNVKLYRKPTACEYCNIIAAFIGNKCQRCTNSEKRYGPPVTCEQCKQKCAFDRKDEDKKVDGKLLCWLCTLSYKRALAKTKQSVQDRREHQRLTRERERDAKRREQAGRPRSHNKRPQRADVTKLPAPTTENKEVVDGPPSKAPRPAVSRVDPHDPEHVVAMTQLKEKIVSLNKQMVMKDQQLLSKDKMITELKAKHFTVENELRNRMLASEREFKTKSEMMSGKIKNLQKEVATLSKMKNTPQSNKKKYVEISDKERIRTVDPKEYLKQKLRKAEKNDSDQKDTDNEDKEDKKSRNTISDDDDDSKDVSFTIKTVKEEKTENSDIQRNGDKGEENGEKQTNNAAECSKIETSGSERNGNNGQSLATNYNESSKGFQKKDDEASKDSDDESVKKERFSDKGSAKDDSDKESDNESLKKERSSDKESAKGDSEKESTKGDSDKDSDKESDDESTRKNNSSDEEVSKKRRHSSDEESNRKGSDSSDDEEVKKHHSSDEEYSKKRKQLKKKKKFRRDSDRDSDKESDKDSRKSDKDSDRDSDKESDKDSDKDSDSDSDA